MFNLARAIFGIAEKKESRYPEQVIDWATEKLVDGTDTRLRFVSGYKRKLRDSVERAVTFVDETVDELPAPLAIDPSAFTTDPRVRAWFGTIETLREAFGLSRPIQEFVANRDNDSLTHFFAGMRATISERTVYVSEQHGDTIQREVARTAFNFTGHRIVTPAATEEALRLNVKERAYMNLVEQSLEQLVSIKQQKSDLEKQRTLLKSKLRTLKSGGLGLEPFASGESGEGGDSTSLERKLEAIDQELGQTAASIETLDEYLLRVVEVMSHPEQRLRVEPGAVRVTQMGFKAAADAAESASDIEYTRVEADRSGAFAIALVSFPVKGLPPPEHFRPRL